MCRRFIASLMLATGLATSRAGAQTFPTRQITLVVPFTAGGPFPQEDADGHEARNADHRAHRRRHGLSG